MRPDALPADVADAAEGRHLVPDLLDAVLDAVPVGVVVRRPDGHVLVVNEASKELLGRRVGGVLPLPDPNVVSHLTLPVTSPGGRVATVDATTVPIAPYGPDVHALVTTLIPQESRPRRAARPAPEAGPGAGEQGGTDPELQSRMGRALDLAERRLRSTTEHSPVGMATLSVDGRILEVNRALCRLLGRDEAALVGARLADLGGPSAPDDREALAGVLAGRDDVVTLQSRYVRPAGDAVWAEATVIGVRDREGRPLHAVLQLADVTEQRLALEMLSHQALHDPLTGLPNRALGVQRLQEALDGAPGRGAGEPGPAGDDGPVVAVLCVDLDRFKVVNDGIGPEQGDRVLVEVAERLQRSLRPEDTAARLSADEFVVVCPGLDEDKAGAQAVTVAERLLDDVREPVVVEGRSVVPTASVGIALSSPSGTGALGLLRDAGAALHHAKEVGAGTWVLMDDDLRRRAVDRLDIEHALRAGVGRGELRLHLQPIVDLRTGTLVGREALVRWQHPERGLLAPAGFLPVAEESGLIQELGRWVLQEAGRIAAATPHLGYVSVNVSPAQVRRASLLHDVGDALDRTGLDPSRLVLELTESVVLGAATTGRRQLRELDSLGVRMVVDDFGTGFAALSLLRELPVSGIKVDRTFTAGLGRDVQCDRIVEALAGLAQGLGVDLVAEGVETEDQRAALQGIGCAHGQGYLFGRPEPALV